MGRVVLLLCLALPALAAAAEPSDKKGQGTPAPKTLADARVLSKTVSDGVAHIQRLVPRAQVSDVRASCVYQRLTEGRVHVQLAREALAILEEDARERGRQRRRVRAGPPEAKKARDETRAAALSRLDHLVRRTRMVEREARLCLDDDRSSIDITRVEVEVVPRVEAAGKVSTGDLPNPPIEPQWRSTPLRGDPVAARRCREVALHAFRVRAIESAGGSTDQPRLAAVRGGGRSGWRPAALVRAAGDLRGSPGAARPARDGACRFGRLPSLP